ncbi:NinG protein [Escherichia phage phi191]|uniref:Protein ninG n=1 Tax=Escherichia phage phi191 TaxID=1458706 RepID=A0A096XEN6_9CAUD|nr:NinG protein [Escherichia phage phi191]AHJ10612.1 NinG protein [Escherichia phage phi191]
MKQRKPKKCKVCGSSFVPFRSYQKVCCGQCALELVRKGKGRLRPFSKRAGRQAESAQEGLTAPQLLD